MSKTNIKLSSPKSLMTSTSMIDFIISKIQFISFNKSFILKYYGMLIYLELFLTYIYIYVCVCVLNSSKIKNNEYFHMKICQFPKKNP
jgi:hypothetical protein